MVLILTGIVGLAAKNRTGERWIGYVLGLRICGTERNYDSEVVSMIGSKTKTNEDTYPFATTNGGESVLDHGCTVVFRQ